VVGEQFHVGDVKALARAFDPEAVDSALQELVRLDLVLSDQGQRVLHRYGFLPPPTT
jgi:hypothetical protein